MASTAFLAGWLLVLCLPGVGQAMPITPPPPPPLVPIGAAAATERQGSSIRINGRLQSARWLWVGGLGNTPQQLWIPLEVLENQLGVTSRSRSDGALELEWFGQELKVPASAQRSLEDEVAVEVSSLFGRIGVGLRREGSLLSLELARPQLLQVRSSNPGPVKRIVLDLGGPATIGRDDAGLVVDLLSRSDQQALLGSLGLQAQQDSAGLRLKPSAAKLTRVFSLGEPNRVVIEWPDQGATSRTDSPAPIDPRLQALLGIAWCARGCALTRSGLIHLTPHCSCGPWLGPEPWRASAPCCSSPTSSRPG
jgi:hypothetical protein